MSSSPSYADGGIDWFDGSSTEDAASEPEAVSANATSSQLPEGVAVAVVDVDPAIQADLASQLGDAPGFATVEELSARLTGVPVVAVLGPSCSQPDALAAAQRILNAHSELGAILLASELSTSLLQQALRSGVKDVLAAPLDPSDLVAAVNRVGSTLQSVSATPVAAGPISFDEFGEGEEPGKVITCFSTKGGAGKSVMASNVAVLLAQRSDRPVCLIDADLQFGDIAVMLKLAPQHTIVDAVGSLDRLDEALIRDLLTTHESSGLLVLPAPLEPAFADQIGAADMVQVVEVLRRFCSHVVVDTPAYFNDVVLGLIEASDDVLLIAGMDIPNIKNVKIGLQTLRLLNTPMEKLRLVLNRSNSKAKLEVDEVERALQISADALIPSDVVVPQSVNKGVPVVLSSPRSGVAKALEELAAQFMPAEATKKKRR
ncbi:MAG: P-loop NTPase [Acidimicrobiia bacterium]|nr:P-loop NTPase [Acidimicrobiia bacterium]